MALVVLRRTPPLCAGPGLGGLGLPAATTTGGRAVEVGPVRSMGLAWGAVGVALAACDHLTRGFLMYRSDWGSVERAKRTILTLPQALHHAAHDYPGGATAIAAVDGVSSTTLNHKLSLTNTTHTPNIRDLELVLDLTRDPRIVDSLLRPIGWVGIDISDMRETDTPEALLAGIGAMLNREGELISHLTRSLSDNHLNCDELAEFELLTERLVQSVFKLGAVVRRKHEEGIADG